jgi:glyoxylase-like metal-dependent hydrolase (beta-lactamase superfamily II)
LPYFCSDYIKSEIGFQAKIIATKITFTKGKFMHIYRYTPGLRCRELRCWLLGISYWMATSLAMAQPPERAQPPDRLQPQQLAQLESVTSAPTKVNSEPIDVGSYTSSAKTFSTRSYWLSSTEGTLLIDTQFLPEMALNALNAAERGSGRKLTHALVLHPNPDKFNGTAVLQARGVKVSTSSQVAQAIPAVHQIRLGWFSDEFKPDYPKEAAQVSVFGDRSQSLNWAGIEVKLHVLGAGCSAAHVVAQIGDAVFVGDLINPENHAWLELGLIDEWLQRLEEIRAMKPKRVFPGRGEPGGIELIAQQSDYLRFVQSLVRAEQPSGSLGWLTKLRLQTVIERQYPELGFVLFMRDGLQAVWDQEAVNESVKESVKSKRN